MMNKWLVRVLATATAFEGLRAGTATKMILNMITVATMIRLGKVYENLMVDLQTRSQKLVDRAKRIIGVLTGAGEAQAARALAAAGNRAKVAIVMLRKKVDRETAEKILARHEGMLRGALES